jgi:hypothetical protein
MTYIPNPYKVGRSQWSKWDNDQKTLFNYVYGDIIKIGPCFFLHPITTQRNVSAEEFSTIAWNAAWTAARMLRDPSPTTEIHTLDDAGNMVSVDQIP